MILDKLVKKFVLDNFGSVSIFEHGKFGQTIFHLHVHYLPFKGRASDIVTEGGDKIFSIKSNENLQKFLQKDGGYLYLSIGNEKWIVTPSLTSPRFFRDRFAKVLHRSERGDWKKMRTNELLMKIVHNENLTTQKLWLNRN